MLTTPRSRTQQSGNDTAEFFAYANISAKLKAYTQILQHNGPRWLGIAKKRVSTIS